VCLDVDAVFGMNESDDDIVDVARWRYESLTRRR
jgi:hypothetical protein